MSYYNTPFFLKKRHLHEKVSPKLDYSLNHNIFLFHAYIFLFSYILRIRKEHCSMFRCRLHNGCAFSVRLCGNEFLFHNIGYSVFCTHAVIDIIRTFSSPPVS